MRKSSGIIMAILLVAFGSMMVAANFALKPYQRYARIGQELTAMLGNLGLTRKGTKIFVLCKGADEKRLAEDGYGMLIELEPTDAVLTGKGRLRRLALRVCREALHLYRQKQDRKLAWFEVKLLLPEEQVHRSLILLEADGRLGPPQPAIPPTWPEKPAPQPSARRASAAR